jgi:hypothetical protein
MINKLGVSNLKELLIFVVGIAVAFQNIAAQNKFELLFTMMAQVSKVQVMLAKLPFVKAEIEDLTADERMDLVQTIMQIHNISLKEQAEKLIFDGLEAVSALFKLGKDIEDLRKKV